VIDEIGTEAECAAARTIAQRGVQLVATAHGNELQNLVKNPALSDLIGGIQSVTLGEAQRLVVIRECSVPLFVCRFCVQLVCACAAGGNSTRQRAAKPGQEPCTGGPDRRHTECHTRCGTAAICYQGVECAPCWCSLCVLVQLVATAHGNELQNLVKNPALADLIGGIQSVTLPRW
jgi:hypothetical protein